MTIVAKRVKFWDIESLPKKAKEVERVDKNKHTFYRCGALLLMKSCMGHLFTITPLGKVKLSSLRLEEISDEFEDACSVEWDRQMDKNGFVTLHDVDLRKLSSGNLGG